MAWDLDTMLTIKKMKFKFELEDPVDEEFKMYIECLTEAHNQMLWYIQDPRNRYRIMEENPIHSKDVMHGVPSLFKQLLNEIIEQVDKIQNEVLVAEEYSEGELARDEQIFYRN